ncbi:phosphonate ABC transporter ATP-binding protein [Candidatus Woesearchaeota archaeon]|jgi:phosphonate transport system ATP-binding protein|nr:phosphonate ABC transporter ATP-binding protein [Candidatus Woesearchaeota archaeon]
MIRIEKLVHRYNNRNEDALKDISLHFKKNESAVIIGSSGSGKSTLLKCINRLIEPSSGDIFIGNDNILNGPIKKAGKIRGKIGMIFQNFNLTENETVLKNVLNGRLRFNSSFKTILGKFSKEDYTLAQENLEKVGLQGYENETVLNLSGGQKQRVAIARTLCQKPDIILADEPVSNLDPKLMKEIMDLLQTICTESGITFIASLHFLDFAKRYGARIIGMRNGKIVFDGKSEDLTEKDIVEIYGKTKEWYLYGKTGF